jgi:Holliday junction DNA helicase RuvA
MIAYLSGKIVKKTDKGIILDTGNIGYFVHISKVLSADLNESDNASLFIHSHIREDAFDLYGFNTYEDLGFFKQLISINGIGPKVATEILSVNSEQVKSAIINEDDKFLCKIPGIGAKTAKRIVLELKGKIDLENLDRPYQKIDEKIDDEAFEALTKLGYQTPQIRKVLNSLPKDLKNTEQIITYFLKNV